MTELRKNLCIAIHANQPPSLCNITNWHGDHRRVVNQELDSRDHSKSWESAPADYVVRV